MGEGGGIEEARAGGCVVTAEEMRLGRCWKDQVGAETKIPCSEMYNQGSLQLQER